MVSHRPTGPSDHNLRVLIRRLRKTQKPTWRVIADRLASTRRQHRVEAGLWRIDKNTKAGDVIAIPGKVLSDGELTHKVIMGSVGISAKALEKVQQAGCEWLSLDNLLDKFPDAKGVRIFF